MKSMKKLVLVAFVLLASVMTLAGCKNDSVPETPKYTVTFDTDGGSAVDSQSVESGKMATKPEDPTLEGSWFLGWYGDKELTKEFDFTSPITNDTEVYAKWSYKFHAKPKILTGYTSPNNTDDTWTYVAFGDWPQTIKASEVTVDESKSKQMGMFTYYLGSDGNCYVKHNDDYYKVEPIIWRVLTENYLVPDENGQPVESGNSLLLAEKILTGGIPYYVNTSSRTIGNATVYPNNYKYSTIRAWLNGLDVVKSDNENDSTYKDAGFLQTAFTPDAQKNIIADTMVDNTARSTNPNSNASEWNSGKNPYACENTEDKIFLLSVQEATTKEYGFGEYNEYGEGNTRIRVTTDYAEATGTQSSIAGDCGWWWWLLRSPSCDDVDDAPLIDYYGSALDSSNRVDDMEVGVVPALSISMNGN